MSSLRERVWRKVEGIIDPFRDAGQEALPREGWRFILYFARQAKGPFLLLLFIAILFSLYLSFINLFQMLLYLLGQREE